MPILMDKYSVILVPTYFAAQSVRPCVAPPIGLLSPAEFLFICKGAGCALFQLTGG